MTINGDGAGSNRRWQFELRDLMTVTAAVAIYAGAFTAVFRDLHENEAQFSYTVLIAMFVVMLPGMTVNMLLARCRIGVVYARLVRKLSRLSWFAQICWLPLLAIIVFYLAGDSLVVNKWPPESSTPVLVRFVFLSGMVAGLVPAIWLLLWHSIDLGEHGLAYDRHTFVAWRRIGRHSHVFDDEGNLVIRHWGWSVVAFVPPEQREAVENLLKDKLGTRSGLQKAQ